jgi:hypothetical protein
LNIKLILIVSSLILLIVLVAIFIPFSTPKKIITSTQNINSFEECVEAGFKVINSNPKICQTNSGKQFNGPWVTVPSKQFVCQVNEDCIPLPSQCHPTSCINKKFESTYKVNTELACTLEYRLNSAYSPEDCICENNICTNKNINK